MDRRVAAAEKAWAKVISIAKNKGRFVGDFNDRALKYAKRTFVAFHMLPPLEIEIPVTALQRSNTFTIRNTSGEPDPDRLPMVNYVVIRKPN